MSARALRLQPGQLFSGSGPHLVSVVLGCCVSVCLWDQRTSAGGINHYLLPRGPAHDASSFRYGVFALPELICRVRALAGPGHRLQARVFGGASAFSPPSSQARLAADNVALAHEVLSAVDIPIVGESVGGSFGRCIAFDFESGEVRSRLLKPEGAPWIAALTS